MGKGAGNHPWERNIAFFLTGQAVSLIGSSLVGYAIMWHVTLKTGSGTMMMAFTVAIMLPMFFISPFGGVWADNYNRKNLINIADGFIAAVTLVIAISYAFGVENIWFLLLCSVARSFGQGVQMPAINALIPQIVPEEKLLRVNGINSMIQSVSMLGTPALAGAILTFFPIQNILFIDVVTAAASITILILFVQVPDPKQKRGAVLSSGAADRGSGDSCTSGGDPCTCDERLPAADNGADMPGKTADEPGKTADAKAPMLAELMDGLRYIREHTFLLRFFAVVACFTFLLAPVALLTPLQVTRNFGPDVWRLTVIEIAFSIGMVVGGLLMATWGGFRNKTFTIASSFLILAAMGVGLGITKVFALYSVFMAVSGITAATSNTPALTVLQQKVDPAYMGRVFSVMTMITSIVMPLGTVAFGPLSDRVSLDIIIIVTSALTGLIGVYVFSDKLLREAGLPD
ncbi:MAG: MFS transporter [Clostridiales bacterium]|nr:MFS transporter [Clostridiales bacterium]